MRKPFYLLLSLIIISSIAWIGAAGILKPGIDTLPRKDPGAAANTKNKISEKIKSKAAEAKAFVKQKAYNEKICFLIDMSLPSGQNRFYVYDLRKDTLQNSGLVTHGRCNESWLEGRKYGNTVGCGCTSLGKYKIGYPYNGRFGLAYKLYGLDKTNDKAFERFVVLHSHDCVPETITDDAICQSDGCPTVSPGYLQQLKPIINSSKKPILLWIFE